MNRIVLIGNGFDLAHGLSTGYTDFINDYWNTIYHRVFNSYSQWQQESYGGMPALRFHEDNFVSFTIAKENVRGDEEFLNYQGDNPFCDFCRLIKTYNDNSVEGVCRLEFKNRFLGYISKQSSLTSWVDIENEYYCLLKSYLTDNNRAELVRRLNIEFNEIKGLLVRYLTEVCKQDVKEQESINDAIAKSIKNNEIANSKKEMLIREVKASMLLMANYPELEVKKWMKESNKHLNNIKAQRTIFLNFNYTNTVEKLYAKSEDIINIHGELNNENNPMIFGYGDELDENHNAIVNLNDNACLENIKSINYLQTDNYRRLLDFIDIEPYQIYIMGHSCGNSDRTLLNTLFEHKNCISIKPYYYIKDDGSDNYIEIIQNIYRNFKDMALMRDVVVNKRYCEVMSQNPSI